MKRGRIVRRFRVAHAHETGGSNPLLAIAPMRWGASFPSTSACVRGTPPTPTPPPFDALRTPTRWTGGRAAYCADLESRWLKHASPVQIRSCPSAGAGDYRHSRLPHVERPTPTGRPDPRQEERGRVGCDCKQCASTRVVGVRVKTPVRARNPQGCAPRRWRDSRLWQAKPLPRLVDTREVDGTEHIPSHEVPWGSGQSLSAFGADDAGSNPAGTMPTVMAHRDASGVSHRRLRPAYPSLRQPKGCRGTSPSPARERDGIQTRVDEASQVG